MPVILAERDYDRWLLRDDQERPPVDLLRPYLAEEMEAHEAHRDVGNVRNNMPELLHSE
jgi:putative SOS response-associated peptidase YedK